MIVLTSENERTKRQKFTQMSEIACVTERPKNHNDPQCSVKKTEEGGLEKHLWDLPHIEHHCQPCEQTNIPRLLSDNISL